MLFLCVIVHGTELSHGNRGQNAPSPWRNRGCGAIVNGEGGGGKEGRFSQSQFKFLFLLLFFVPSREEPPRESTETQVQVEGLGRNWRRGRQAGRQRMVPGMKTSPNNHHSRHYCYHTTIIITLYTINIIHKNVHPSVHPPTPNPIPALSSNFM